MLAPMILPDDTPKVVAARAAEYCLGLTDIATLFGVARQTAYEWTVKGRRAPGSGGTWLAIPHLRPPSRDPREPIRYRYREVAAWADKQGLPAYPERLPMQVQEAAGLPVTPQEVWLNESDAARQLGVGRSLLWKRRTLARLNPALRVQHDLRGARYNLADVREIAAGRMPLWAEKEEPG